MQSDNQKQGLWISLSKNPAVQMLVTVVVIAVLIALAAKYVW
jgi:hypothetical protein